MLFIMPFIWDSQVEAGLQIARRTLVCLNGADLEQFGAPPA